MDVAAWLEELGLAEHAEAFAENGVDADLLAELTNEDLKDLGVHRLAERKRLLKAIAQLGDGENAPEGTPASPVAADGERRQVTVLFADLAGYTRLAGELGAEATLSLLNRYFETVDGIVESYGGKVDKHIGDSVMAVFGAPIAHDDDPLRAIRTAVEIHEAMEKLSAEAGRRLLAHVGIASGQVVASGAGSEAHREYTVIGNSVNLASRLQDRAESGETLISEALYRAVAEEVDSEPLGEVSVKGMDEAVRIWRVKSLSGAGRAPTRVTFVGRQAELAQFSGLVEACRQNGAGQAVIVRGEAGIGKTRLLEEFTRIATEKGFVVHKGLVLDFGVSKGQDAIRSVVHGLLGIAPGSEEDTRQDRAAAVTAEELLAPEQRVFLNDLLDLPQSFDERATYDAMDNATRNDGKRKVLADLLHRMSARAPVVVIIEDVHWANPLMLTHLAKMAATVANCPALLVMTSRIEGDPLDQAWRSTTEGCPLMTVDLSPLRREDALRLAGTFIDSKNRFALDCVQRAEGNPLFLEQLLRNVEEQGGEEVPASIQSLVLARMDRLSSHDKEALQAASVLGQRFSLEALRHLIDDRQYLCGELMARHLVRPEGDNYLFAHALVQEGVYSSLLTTRRAELHRRAAAWYGPQDPALRAEHLDRAEDPDAAAAYLEAAEAQSGLLHFETALRLAERGIELAADPAVACDLTCLRGDALRNLGATEESIAAFGKALETAEDDAQRCRAWIGMADGLRFADRQKPALEILDKAQAAADRHGLAAERAQIHYLRGNVYFPLGNIDGCLEEHEKALIFAREAGATEGEALALSGLGDAHYLRGHMQTAFEQFAACVEVCRKNGYGRIEVANRHMMGWTRVHLLELREALEDAMASVKTAAEVSHHRAELLGLMLIGRVEMELGNFANAQENLEHALDLARTMSASNFEAQTLSVQARLSTILGRPEEARDLAREAVAIVRDVGVTFIGPSVLAVWAEVSEDPQESRKALKEAEAMLDSGCVAHNHFWFAQTAIEHSLAHMAWDEAERYAARLESYIRAQPLAWPSFMAARGRALGAWGRGHRTEELAREMKRLHDLAVGKGLMLAVPALERAMAAA